MSEYIAFENKWNLYEMVEEHGEEVVREFLKDLTPEQCQLLYSDPYFTLRKSQIVREDGRFGTMALAGRGFGKTFMGSVWVNIRAYQKKGPILLVGQTASDVRDTMIESNPSSIIEMAPDWFKPKYEPSKRLLTWPNGVIAFARSGDEPEQLRGQNSQTLWADELAKWQRLDESWSNLIFGLRQGDDPQYLITTTPRPKPLIKQLYYDDKCVVVSGSTYENAANLNDKALDEMRRMYEGTALGEQELHGKIIWEDDKALWTRANLDRDRMLCPENVLQYIIGVDPTTGTGNKRNDEAGIIVACVAYVEGEKHGFVLEDYSIKGGPAKWSAAVKRALDDYPRAMILAESNQGGEMIRQTLANAGISAGKVKLKHHIRSKYERAQPVALLAEQGLIHHTKEFTILEDEMTSFTGEANEKSPNRLDAAVIALHHLLVNNRAKLSISRLGI